jgi:hypothetical protein
MACPVCGSAYYAAHAQSPTTTNECQVCRSEWTDYWGSNGKRTAQKVTKNTHEVEQPPEGTGDQPAGEPSLA